MSSVATQKLLRQLPSVDSLLQDPAVPELLATYGRSLTTETLRNVLAETRQRLTSGDLSNVPSSADLLRIAAESLAGWRRTALQPVINATGIIIHTNLGRAPLSQAALAAMAEIAAGYSTLEYDLGEGRRGPRAAHVEHAICQLTGAEAALVVNNNAAGILLMLSSLCRDRDVIISRGQLVEIGGGFRIPDVLAQSGARLVEVGTTNRTHLQDYATAINDNTAAILVVHPSNYKIVGYASQPDLLELAELARASGIDLLFDQGSGELADLSPYGVEPDTTVADGLHAGCHVVAFSGDKLLGGPQAGVLCGSRSHIDRLRRHPLARAVRADKLCLAALDATLHHYLVGEEWTAVPVLRMIAMPTHETHQTAARWLARLETDLAGTGASLTIVPGESRVGGGSVPGSSLPTHLLAITADGVGPDELAERLRQQPTPVIGRIQDDRLLLDPRTVLVGQEELLLEAIGAVLRPS